MSEHTSVNLPPANDDSAAHGGSASMPQEPLTDDRREELDDLIWKAQELVRNLDTLSMTTEIPDEETEPAFAGEPTTIAELDMAIASSADREMKKTVSATVDSVLDQVFEERAVLVQTLDAPVTPIIDVAEPEAATRTQVIDEAPVPAPEVVAAPVPVEPPIPAPQLVSTAVLPTPPIAPAPAATANALPVQVVESASKASIAPAEPRPSIRARLEKLARPAIPLLMIVNFPLRFVPPSLRPVVDWAALSLLVWVPIIWIMVATLGSKAQHAKVEITEAMHHEAPASPQNHATSGH
jgi:hypothetical protein